MGLVPQRRVFTEHLSIISCPLFFWKRKAEKIGCEGRGIFFLKNQWEIQREEGGGQERKYKNLMLLNGGGIRFSHFHF